ncbi:MAG: twitching motility protein PilT [Ilumatobacteraceae bacterium]
MAGLTYDRGALIAAERDDQLLWSLHRAALRRGLSPTVPSVVIAEAWRGGPQHRLSQFLKGCRVEPLCEEQARAVGALAGSSGLDDIVDVAVVEGALRRGDAVVTSNRSHVAQVADSVQGNLRVHDV